MISTTWVRSMHRSSRAAAQRRTLALAAAVGLGLAAAPAPEAAADSPPRLVVQQTVDAVLVVLNEDGLSTDQKRSRIEAIAYERFDFPTLSRLVLARNWQRFSKEQQTAFMEEFKRYLAVNYGNRIERYDNQKVEITGERKEPRGDVTIQSVVRGGEFEGAVVDYRMRESKGQWLVIDVIIEGISLVSNFRDQFKEVLARGGPEELLQKLREKNAGRPRGRILSMATARSEARRRCTSSRAARCACPSSCAGPRPARPRSWYRPRRRAPDPRRRPRRRAGAAGPRAAQRRADRLRRQRSGRLQRSLDRALRAPERRAPPRCPTSATAIAMARGQLGTYIVHLPVDQGFTCEAGRTIWGFPKTVQKIDIDYSPQRVTCKLVYDGVHALTLALPRGGSRALPETDLATFTYIEGILHRTAFRSQADGFGARLGGAELTLGAGPLAAELRSLGLPRKALLTTWMERMSARFEAAQKL